MKMIAPKHLFLAMTGSTNRFENAIRSIARYLIFEIELLLLTIPLSHPTNAVALFSIPDMVPVLL
jgi:hypothetical protein